MKQVKSKLWKKIILVCVLLGVVPTILVGTVSYFIASNTVQKKVSEGNTEELNQAKLSVESQLISVEKTMLQFISSPTVAHAASAEMTGDQFDVFNELQSTIDTLPTAGMEIGNIRLFNTAQHWVVSNSGVGSQSDYESEYGPVSQLLNDSRLSYWADAFTFAGNNASPQAAASTNHSYVTLVRRNVYSNDACFCTVDVPYESFDTLVSGGSRLNTVTIVSPDGCVIYDRSYYKRGKNIASTALFKQVEKSNLSRGSFILPIAGVRSDVTFIKSDSNGWIYLMVTSVAQMTRDSQMIGWVTVLICLVLITLIAMASLTISNRAYRPIRHLYNVLVGDKPGQPDEIRQIEEHVGLLLTNQNDMKSEIYSQSGQLMEYFSVKLLLNENDESFILSKLRLFHYPEKPPHMVVAVIQIDPLKGGVYGENDEDLLLYAVNNIVGETFSDCIVITPVILAGRQVTVLRVGDAYKDGVYPRFRNLQELVQQKLEFTLSVSISLPFDDYRAIHFHYTRCLYAMQYQFFPDRSTVSFVEDLTGHQRPRLEYPTELEGQILDAVRTGDKTQCFAMIHLFVENLFRDETGSDAIKIFLTRLAINLIILQQETDPHAKASGLLLLSQLSGMRDRSGIENWLQHTIAEPVIDCLEKSTGDRMKQICQDTLAIIQREYNTKLTLESCAARLNYHPSYIRRVLKKEMGINFSDYLQHYRVKIAERWLMETDMKVAVIAEKLAYENAENFIRSFKKVTGMTPRQYRDGSGGT